MNETDFLSLKDTQFPIIIEFDNCNGEYVYIDLVKEDLCKDGTIYVCDFDCVIKDKQCTINIIDKEKLKNLKSKYKFVISKYRSEFLDADLTINDISLFNEKLSFKPRQKVERLFIGACAQCGAPSQMIKCNYCGNLI